MNHVRTQFTAGVINSGSKFATCAAVNFVAGVVETSDKTMTAISDCLPPYRKHESKKDNLLV
jgi:hypothetical protein